jgi:hypothetical protein
MRHQSKLSSRIGVFGLLFALASPSALAGSYGACVGFSYFASVLYHWSHGALGVVVSMTFLLVGLGLAYRLQSLMPAVITSGAAFAFYFGPMAVMAIFGQSPSTCFAGGDAALLTSSAFSANYASCRQSLSTNPPPAGSSCTCDGTSTSPNCNSNYQLCLQALPGYATGGASCGCPIAFNSATPTCVSPTSTFSYNGAVHGGNSFSISTVTPSGATNVLAVNSPQADAFCGGTPCYSGSLQYMPSAGTFSGCVNITGTVQTGPVCGGNSGICGAGSSIIPNSSPAGSCGPAGQAIGPGGVLYPASTQLAYGNPINWNGGTFTGGPITVNTVYGSFVMSPDTAPGKTNCLLTTFNGAPQGAICY